MFSNIFYYLRFTATLLREGKYATILTYSMFNYKIIGGFKNEE